MGSTKPFGLYQNPTYFIVEVEQIWAKDKAAKIEKIVRSV